MPVFGLLFYGWVLDEHGESYQTRHYESETEFRRVATIYLNASDVVRLDCYKVGRSSKPAFIESIRKRQISRRLRRK